MLDQPREGGRQTSSTRRVAGRGARTALSAKQNDGGGGGGTKDGISEDEIIDAIIEEAIIEELDGRQKRASDERDFQFKMVPKEPEQRRRKRDILRESLRKLASLSLEDYKWRSSVFKRNEADRKVEESLARMMGEDPAYVRPMDAGEEKIGPLGRAEKRLVKWLSKVIEEEGKRAKKIANSEGDLVRPMEGEGGPLADLESQAVSFVDSIRNAEKERWRSGAIRPKDVDESKRGPLGEAEARAVSVLKEISSAERMRMEQSKLRGGEVVRPIDVPGPLGEVEKTVMEMMTAEKQRARDREMNEGKVVRPMDATMSGPLGDAERQATEALDRLKEEEKERLNNIKRVLEERRPMEADRASALGMTEAFTVGLLRGPRLLGKVAERVKELLQSEKLSEEDQKMLIPSPNDVGAESKIDPASTKNESTDK